MNIEGLFVYTWDGVLRDYEPGRISVVATNIVQARQAAIEDLYDSDDKHMVRISEPNSIVAFTVPFVFTESGSG